MREFVLKSAFLAAIAMVTAIAGYTSRHSPDLPSVAGAYIPGNLHDVMSMPIDYHTPAKKDSYDEIFIQATIHHEMIHSLKSMDIVDLDIPMASAWGYLFEWGRRGTITDTTKLQYFDEGRNAVNLGTYISEIIMSYRRKFAKEDAESYEDGARLAGAVSALFEETEEQKMMLYLVALGFPLDHASAKFAVENPELFGVMFKYRLGMYFTVDYDLLDGELESLPPTLKDRAVQYINALREDRRIGLVRDEVGTIDMPLSSDALSLPGLGN